MRTFAYRLITLATIGLAACTSTPNQTGPSLFSPLNTWGASVANASANGVRGKVEIFVKTNHPGLIEDIRRGGGPTLTTAFDIANAPQSVRPLQTLRLQSNLPLYASNLDALTLAILTVAG